jgi:hypothetical protein
MKRQPRSSIAPQNSAMLPGKRCIMKIPWCIIEKKKQARPSAAPVLQRFAGLAEAFPLILQPSGRKIVINNM